MTSVVYLTLWLTGSYLTPQVCLLNRKSIIEEDISCYQLIYNISMGNISGVISGYKIFECTPIDGVLIELSRDDYDQMKINDIFKCYTKDSRIYKDKFMPTYDTIILSLLISTSGATFLTFVILDRNRKRSFSG